jgi:undecaprenyl-diphosphatase
VRLPAPLPAAAGLLFAALAALVAAGTPALLRFDIAVHEAAVGYSTASPVWLGAMRAVTRLGDTVTVLAVDTITALACVRLGRPGAARFVVVAGLGTWLVSQAPRFLIGRGRPADPLWTVNGYAFPSGHTTNSTAMALILILVVGPALAGAARSIVVTVLLLVPPGVGLSRIVGGVHWPSDVAGGLLLAVATVGTAAILVPPDPPGPDPGPD